MLTGVAATYALWLLFAERTIFQFYTIVILPFMLLALMFALREIAGADRTDPVRRRSGQRTGDRAPRRGRRAVGVLRDSLWTATQVPYDFIACTPGRRAGSSPCIPAPALAGSPPCPPVTAPPESGPPSRVTALPASHCPAGQSMPATHCAPAQ